MITTKKTIINPKYSALNKLPKIDENINMKIIMLIIITGAIHVLFLPQNESKNKDP
jgi:hypothetical protein